MRVEAATQAPYRDLPFPTNTQSTKYVSKGLMSMMIDTGEGKQQLGRTLPEVVPGRNISSAWFEKEYSGVSS